MIKSVQKYRFKLQKNMILFVFGKCLNNQKGKQNKEEKKKERKVAYYMRHV